MTADGRMTIWMRLRNAREVVAGLRQTAAATTLLGNATERLALKMDRAGRRTFLMNQALFTLRRYSYFVTLGLTAATFAVAKWGFSYLSQVQNAELAFKRFGMTSAQVNAEIATLYRLAAISPFLFTDITTATRRFIAFGLSTKQANETVYRLSDALVTFGSATGASMKRASVAFAHLLSLGHLTGQITTQLSRDNIPIALGLAKVWGKTTEEVAALIKSGQITAKDAIDTWNTYVRTTKKFQGASLAFATRTWTGIITTTRDYLAQFMGTIERPLFNRLQKSALRFMTWLTSEQVNKLSRKGDIAGVIGTFSPGAARVWELIAKDMKAVWLILVNGVIPAFRTIISYVGPPIYVMLYLISSAFAFLGRHTLLAKIFFGLLALEVGVLILRYTILLPLQAILLARMITINTIQRIAIALGLARIETINLETGAIVRETAATERQQIVATRFGSFLLGPFRSAIVKTTVLWSLLTKGYIVGSTKMSYSMKSMEGRALRLRWMFIRLRTAIWGYVVALRTATLAMIRFLFTNPIGWAILLIGLMVILYLKWKWFHNIVNRVFFFIRDHSLVIAAALTVAFGPIGAAVAGLILIIKYWNRIKHFFGSIFGGGGGRNSTALGGGPRYAGRMGLQPHYVGAAGLGSQPVRPIGTSAAKISGAGDAKIEINIHHKSDLIVDGKKMAESVSKHRLDGSARR